MQLILLIPGIPLVLKILGKVLSRAGKIPELQKIGVRFIPAAPGAEEDIGILKSHGDYSGFGYSSPVVLLVF